MDISYSKLEKAVELFDLIGLETKKQVKQKYIKLSKEFHPDKQGGDTKKYQQINEAYKVLSYYMDNFKFKFSKEEFKTQYPFSLNEDGPWSLW